MIMTGQKITTLLRTLSERSNTKILCSYRGNWNGKVRNADGWPFCVRPNSPGPHTHDWKVTENSSVNLHDMYEEKHLMEIYG